MLNDQQKAVSEEWIQYHIENAEWIGHDNFKIGDANNEIIWNGRQMTISDQQDVEMGIITLEAMPESVEEMQNFRPDFEPYRTSLLVNARCDGRFARQHWNRV